ncbi:MAG: hypothetical protein NC078_02380 [Ruminococcus sp.]|nr:hypothetical protein [Ruminococcus sp.]
MIAATVCVIISILKGISDVPKWFVLLNPIAFPMIGVAFRKINPKRFYDLPGIIMPSLGMGMFGLIAVVSIL